MDRETTPAISVELLADRSELISTVARMRWEEWGDVPERAELAWWVQVTERESGRDLLPVTFVAVTSAGDAVGAVGLDEFDIEERRDRSPWIVGTIVHRDRRGEGVGTLLLNHLEAWAASRRIPAIWVATGPPAVGFYQRCGYSVRETLQQRLAGFTFVLVKQPPDRGSRTESVPLK